MCDCTSLSIKLQYCNGGVKCLWKASYKFKGCFSCTIASKINITHKLKRHIVKKTVVNWSTLKRNLAPVTNLTYVIINGQVNLLRLKSSEVSKWVCKKPLRVPFILLAIVLLFYFQETYITFLYAFGSKYSYNHYWWRVFISFSFFSTEPINFSWIKGLK